MVALLAACGQGLVSEPAGDRLADAGPAGDQAGGDQAGGDRESGDPVSSDPDPGDQAGGDRFAGDQAGGGSGDPLAGLDWAGLPEGGLWAVVAASREIVREPAAGAPDSDSQAALWALVPPAVTHWWWRVVHSASGAVLAESDAPAPTFSCGAGQRGAYDVYLAVSDGLSKAEYRHRRLLTCTLPRVAAGRTVHHLDLAGAPSIYLQGGRIGGVAVQPGDLIRVSGTNNGRAWVFLNFEGSSSAPIHILNDGLVRSRDTDKLLHFVNCRHLIVDGAGDDAHAHGIVLSNALATGAQGLFVRNYTEGSNVTRGATDIEIFGVHIDGNPGTGIEVNTKGSAEFNRDNWRFERLAVHHNLVERTGNEGLYLGYTRDWLSTVGGETHYAYQIYDAAIYRNTIRQTGYDGLQVCNLVEGMEVHDNLVRDAGTDLQAAHLSSFQLNAGCSGHVFANQFVGGGGSNMQVGCTGGDLWLYANVWVRRSALAGSPFYLHAGRAAGVDWRFFGNTIVADSGPTIIRFNANSPGCNEAPPVQMQSLLMVNALALTPTGATADIFAWDSPAIALDLTEEPNLTAQAAELCLVDAANDDYRIGCAGSPALSGGARLPDLGLDPAALPLRAFTDARGRVSADPRGFGAYQSSE